MIATDISTSMRQRLADMMPAEAQDERVARHRNHCANMRKRWQNPAYRAKVRAIQLGKKVPKRSEAMKANWTDPEYRARQKAARGK